MAITLDTIVNKVFTDANKGYDKSEVESFLDEILEEMENREAETERLKAKIEELTRDLEAAKAAKPVAAPAAAAPTSKTVSDKHTTESFELVLTKAKSAYEEIVAAADARADEIIAKANEEAATIRSDAESQISDLTEKLARLRSQTSNYYTSLKKLMDAQNASMDQIKKLL